MERKLVDWHTADIIAAVRKKGTTVAGLSRAAGLGDSTLANALSRPWPKGEKLLAEAIGVEPWVIWPTRYHDPVTRAFIDRGALIRKSKKAT